MHMLIAQASDNASDSSSGLLDKLGQLDTDTLVHLITTYGLGALTALLILVVALIVSSWLGGLVSTACRRGKIEETLSRFFGKCARWGILLIAGLFILGSFGIETSSFAVVLGSVGLAIGLAFQGTLGNIAAGVMLLIFRPFKVGDYIKTAGEEGVVEEIDLFTTAMNTLDNRYVILPNGQVFGAVIMNYTRNPRRRVDVSVSVHYKHDLKQVRDTLEQALQGIEHGIYNESNHAPCAYLVDLGDHGVRWSLRLWCKPEHYWEVREKMTQQAKVCLDQAHLAIPYQHMDVRLFKEED